MERDGGVIRCAHAALHRQKQQQRGLLASAFGYRIKQAIQVSHGEAVCSSITGVAIGLYFRMTVF